MTVTPDAATWSPAQSVSYSSMTLHRTCPMAWSYRYLDRLETVSLGQARDLGSWWHLLRAMDSLDRGSVLGSLEYLPRVLRGGDDWPHHFTLDSGATTDQPIYVTSSGRRIDPGMSVALDAADAYWRTLNGDDRDRWQEFLGPVTLAERLERMDTGWRMEWADDLNHEAPLGVEVKFRRTLPGDSGATMPGYVDEVYLDTRRNLVVIRDHKTHGKMPSQESLEDLTDSQLHLYAWGAAPMISEWGFGPVRAISYDRVRTTAPKQPVLTASGALSKSVSDYDLDTYLRWAAGPDGQGVPWGEPDTFFKTGKRAGEPKFGYYTAEESVIEKLSTPAARSVWFQRTLTPLNRNVIVSHLRATVDTQRQAARTVATYDDTGEAPRNFTRWGCRICDYASLCRAQMLGGPNGDYPLADYGLTRRGD